MFEDAANPPNPLSDSKVDAEPNTGLLSDVEVSCSHEGLSRAEMKGVW